MPRKETIFRLAKGYRGRAKNCFRLAIRRVQKGLQNAYRERHLKKREARATNIMQVGAGSREHGLAYSKLINGLYCANIGLNRKMLSALARQEPYSFRAIVEEVRLALAAAAPPTARPHGCRTLAPLLQASALPPPRLARAWTDAASRCPLSPGEEGSACERPGQQRGGGDDWGREAADV